MGITAIKRWMKQLFCLHTNWNCLNIDAHFFGWEFGRCHECRNCGKRKIFAPGKEPVNFDVNERKS